MTYLIESLGACGAEGLLNRQHTLSRQLLRRLTGTDIVEHDAEGAPFLPSRPDLHISISHCRTAVAVAVSDTAAVGIDIECRRRIGDGLIERVCTPDERDAIDRSDDSTMEFLRFWTQKEAVLKCRGTGIRGFGSMIDASTAHDCTVTELATGLPDTVAALAVAKAE